MTDLLQTTIQGGVATLTLNRPEKLNALSTALEQSILDALAAGPVADARVIVFAGAGERAFSAGADVGEIAEFGPADIMRYYQLSGRLYEAIAGLDAITIAAVHGYCFGAGFELALACDLRVADETAVFALPEVGIGIVPSSGGLARIARHIGLGRAKYLALTGERLPAARALDWGLLAQVVEPGGVLEAAHRLAFTVADQPALAASAACQILDVAVQSPHAANLLLERYAYAMLNQANP
ncbi:enoyl-CoA hydratase/isomerase family protein [Micrococcales bacterium 31B]|nr:enoyl-CoA hydratase/isomerase family protein [Micrococcales bacterium 31B]